MCPQMIQCSLPNCLSGKCLLPLLQPPLFKQTKEEREISEKVVFLQQGSSAFLESQVKKQTRIICVEETFFSLRCH